MGYHATGSGRLIFTKNVEDVRKMMFGKETGDEIIEDLFCNWFSRECDYYDTEDSIYLWHPDDWNYRDDFVEVLEKLAVVTKKGRIEFAGEDDCHWCVEYNPQLGCWKEKNGRIVYEDEVDSMNRYIDADKFMKVLEEDIPLTDNPIKVMASAIAALEEQPTADVRENVKGHWVADRYCSVCDFDKYEIDCCCGMPQNYCPNCGAQMMRGEA